MRKIKILSVIALSIVAGLATACSSSGSNTATIATTPTNTNQAVATTTNTSAANNAATNAHKTDEEIPGNIKAVFPDAQTFTKQHKDVPAEKIARIEKDTGGRVPDKDHHSYLAFATKDGKRAQIGAATLLKADGKEMIVVYESKNGMPTVREVRAEGIAKEFLAQFAGKNHDAPVKFGEDIKALGGINEAQAKEIAQAVRIDIMTMEALYGAAHTH
jgi:hypothetical protein